MKIIQIKEDEVKRNLLIVQTVIKNLEKNLKTVHDQRNFTFLGKCTAYLLE